MSVANLPLNSTRAVAFLVVVGLTTVCSITVAADDEKTKLIERFVADKQDLNGKLLFFQMTARGILGRRDKDSNVIRKRETEKLLFAVSRTEGAADEWFSPTGRWLTVYRNNEQRKYLYERGKLIQVDSDCKRPIIPMGYEVLCYAFNQEVWAIFDEISVGHDTNVERLQQLDWGGYKDVPQLGNVAVLSSSRVPRPDREFSKKTSDYYFGERHGKLVFLGQHYIGQSKTEHDLHGECVVRNHIMTKAQYGVVSDMVLPVAYTERVMREILDFDFQPLQKPTYLKDIEMTIDKITIEDSLPQRFVNIAIPEGTPIYDNCQQQEQIAIAREIEESQGFPFGRYLGVIVGVVVLAAGVWIFMKRR